MTYRNRQRAALSTPAGTSFTWTLSGLALAACGGGGGGGGSSPVVVADYDITVYDEDVFDAVIYADENRNEVVLVLEDYIDDIASGIGNTTIEIHEFI